jgi:hypothetical protein
VKLVNEGTFNKFPTLFLFKCNAKQYVNIFSSSKMKCQNLQNLFFSISTFHLPASIKIDGAQLRRENPMKKSMGAGRDLNH